jgi:hypothetical protein
VSATGGAGKGPTGHKGTALEIRIPVRLPIDTAAVFVSAADGYAFNRLGHIAIPGGEKRVAHQRARFRAASPAPWAAREPRRLAAANSQ